MIIVASCILNYALFKYTIQKPNIEFKEKATISLSICDFLRAFVGYSTELSMAAFNSAKRQSMCISFGFLIPFFSYTAIFLLTELILERWQKIKRSLRPEDLPGSGTKSNFAIALCWVLALILSGMPLLKVGAYDLDTSQARCSVIWKAVSTTGTTYVIFLFFLAFLLPLLIIVVSFVGLQCFLVTVSWSSSS